MKGKLKSKDVQLMQFYNDDYKLTLIFQPIDDTTEPPIDPPVEPIIPNIPTGMKLDVYDINSLQIPTGIKLSTYNKENHGKRN